MAFIDRMNTFSNAQVVTATAISTDVLDTNNTGSPNGIKDLGIGDGMQGVTLNVTVPVAFAGGTSIQINLESSAAEGMTSPTVHWASPAIPLAQLTQGAILARVPLPAGNYLRYMGVRYTVVGTMSGGGAVDAFLTKSSGEVGVPRPYASGFSVA
jgi:hypothetical protein